MASSSPPLIKGYLPLRLQIPLSRITSSSAVDADDNDQHASNKTTVDTFLYVKPHQGSNNTNSNNSNNTTLFVANAPIIPGIDTPLLLKSIFGRYGDVAQCLVVPNPRRHKVLADETSLLSSSSLPPPSFLVSSQNKAGRFAHVIFKSGKDLKRTMKQLTQVMMEPVTTKEDDDSIILPGLALETIELQTLADETDRQRQQQQLQQQERDDDEDENDSDNDNDDTTQQLTGLAAVAHRYRASRQPFWFDRDRFHNGENALMEECNARMQAWEAAQEAARQAREAAAAQPDEDGFVTVTYNNNKSTAMTVGGDNDDETGPTMTLETDPHNKRRKKSQRSRGASKKQKAHGASELKDFYRFQTKEQRQKNISELRQRFEQDLAKVKQLKEEKQYRPF